MIKYQFIIWLILFSAKLHAAVETTVSYLQGVDFLHYAIYGSAGSVTNTSILEIPNFNPLGNSDWENGYKIRWVKSRVELYIDPAAMPLTYAYKLTIPIKISFLDINHTLHEENHKLIIDYNPDEGSAHRQLDLYLQEGAYRFQVEVLTQSSDLLIEKMTVTSNQNPPNLTQIQKKEIANSVKVKLVQEYDKIINFDYNDSLKWSQMNFSFNSANNQLNVCWDVIQGTEYYDLEWSFVEKYNIPYVYSNLGITSSTFSFSANASRVSITENCYKMPIVYESGALVFRVRAHGYVLPDIENPVTGRWSCGSMSGTCNSYDGINPSLANWLHAYWIHDPHENDNKNWQVITSFAEEGKRKDVVNYMDGTMRTRQTVTVNNSDNNVLVAETIYDHQGRPAVQILPAPVLHDPALKFRNNFNRNLANQPYTKLDFDLDGPACRGQSSPLSVASGASYYYSQQFYNSLTPTEKESHLAYIPKSEKYPMIQTEYTPDNTGRIQRQGGAGPTFQLESGHETKYFYATPAQEELDYLFGTNVGIASHYKKNMVIDPNTQVSISYLDAKGNTIATALAAKAPDNLEQLPSYKPFPMTINLLAYNRVDSSNYSLDATFTLAVDSKGDHTFYYGVTAEQFRVDNCMPANVCYDCVYDLELLVVSNECPDTFYHLIKTIGSFIDTSIALDINNQDSLVFDINTTCNTPLHFNTNLLAINNEFVIRDLPVGTYSIIKRLKVNQNAALAYLEHYINDPNNICTNILEGLLEDQLEDVDEDDCNIDCEDVAESTEESDKEMASEICDTLLTNPCEISLEVMKAHFMPGGQYCEFEKDFYIVWLYPMSVLNVGNHLCQPHMDYTTINWQPQDFVQVDGVLKSPAQLTPKEFIQNFEESWLDSFVVYHPEYCMYTRCRDSLSASETYSNYLHSTNILEEAINPSGNIPAFLSSVTSDLIYLHDPYFFFQADLLGGADNPGPGQYQLLRDKMISYMNFFPTGDLAQPSIWNIAAANIFCGSLDNTACLTTITVDYLQNTATTEAANLFWINYKSLYITCKEKVEYFARSKYAMTEGNCYNECIGQNNFNPFINDFETVQENGTFPDLTYFFEGEYFNDLEPCSQFRYSLFRNKSKAFPSPYDMLPNMDVDFWAYPPTAMMDNVLPSLPLNPCDTCNCSSEFNRLMNYILFNILIPGINTPFPISSITYPMSSLALLFPDFNLGYNPVGGSLHFYKYGVDGKIGIIFGNYPANDGCTIQLGVDSLTLIDLDSVHTIGCPVSGPIVTTGNFQIELFSVKNKIATVTGNVNQCAFSCKNAVNKNCKALCIASDLLSAINQTHWNGINSVITSSMPSQKDSLVANNIGDCLKDSLRAKAWDKDTSIITTVINGQQINIQLLQSNCTINLYLGIHNLQFGSSSISFFSDLIPNYSHADVNGYTDYFYIDVHLSDGTVYKASGQTNGCFSIGRCCKEEIPQTQRSGTPKVNKSKKQETKKIITDKSRKKKLPYQLPTDPYPLPSDPELPSKPFDPLCNDCLQIELIGGVFDTVVFPDCIASLCDSSSWITMELDSMPDPCIEHQYDVAEYNAYVLYEEMINNISAEFLHAYNMKCLNAAEQFNDTYQYAQHHFTLYYYDQSNNLVQTVPPNGVEGLDPTEMAQMSTYRTNYRTHIVPNPPPVVKSIVPGWTSNYTYNSLNQLTTQKIPDQGIMGTSPAVFNKEPTLFWYDYLGRLVCSQNPEQKKKLEFSYTLYDWLGRIKEVGGLKFTAASFQPPPSPINTTLLAWGNFVNNGNKFEITTTTYDHDFYNGTLPPGFPLSSVDNLRGRVGSAAIYDTETNYNILKPDYITHYSYDIHGNVKALVQDGKNTQAKLMEYEYDLISGKVNKVYYQRNKSDQFIHDYRYDADNRLTLVRTSHNGILWDEDAHYVYYPHGPLARTEIGEDEIQGLDYAYTLQGWIKGMNSGNLQVNTDMGKDGMMAQQHQTFAKDEVGYILNYYQGDYNSIAQHASAKKFETEISSSIYNTASKNLYNGNIRAMITAIDRFMGAYGKDGPAGYSYQYDQLNRIKGMDYYTGLSNNSWISANKKDDYQTRYSYDANGNILNLDRYGTTAGGNQLKMDAFAYNYKQQNNRLTHVDDLVNVSNYTTDIDDQQANNYKYDRIGNLIRDEAEGLSIEWNLSGKVSRIKKDNGDVILFKYDALGNRISKRFKDTTTLYVRDASGNVMSHYMNTAPSNSLLQIWNQQSVTLYGSSRLGEWYPRTKKLNPPDTDIELPDGSSDHSTPTGGASAREIKIPKPLKLQRYRGLMQYELTNHLGNVLATISDRKRLGRVPVGSYGTGIYAHLITAGDYYPFGSPMPDRSYSTNKFRYGFNRQEKDSEIQGNGVSYAFEYRIHDARLGRFFKRRP
ncbi:MAG: RHS repeat protein [Saprospiraceae bacterium]|nr:RHS repeat protein [Saprospiraceae bacterium]